MTEQAQLPRAPGPLRVAIDAIDPLVGASLAAYLEGEVELAGRAEAHNLLLWDAGASRAATRERLAMLPTGGSALVLIADPSDASAAFAAGAQGVLLRALERERLLAAVRAVHHGLTVLDAGIAARVLPVTTAPLIDSEHETLTAREREVLQLVADGLSNRRIGARLGVSEHTAKFHVNAILEKLGADSRTQAVVTAVRRGLLWL